ncbi:MAG: hypothetical protein G5Z42_02170 [Caldisphaeraceae archaeon]|nr:hypothetical protein [Caldisphaeraceae archaeon]MEB3691568.1 hypothetical protein [Caldisphaeraceae archaeon]MEB3797612.1 hypothetical protein [Caldisphaeraceae archaeon]
MSQPPPEDVNVGSNTGESSVKDVAEALRDTASQLRAIINDLTNPLLRVSLQSQSDVNEGQYKANQASQTKQASQQEEAQGLNPSLITHEERIEHKQIMPQKMQEKAYVKEEERVEKKVETKKDKSTIFKLLSLISELYMMPKEFFEQLIDAMKSLGYLSQEEAEATKKLLNVMIMASNKGLNPSESLALISLMLNEVSGENNELIKNSLTEIVINKLKRQEEAR